MKYNLSDLVEIKTAFEIILSDNRDMIKRKFFICNEIRYNYNIPDTFNREMILKYFKNNKPSKTLHKSFYESPLFVKDRFQEFGAWWHSKTNGPRQRFLQYLINLLNTEIDELT